MATYRYLPFSVILCQYCNDYQGRSLLSQKLSTPSVGMRLTEYLQFICGPSEGLTARLRPVGRPYGPSTARWKAVRFTLRTISRTYGQLGTPFRRQPRRHLRRDFLRISFVFYGFIFTYFFYIFGFIKASYRGYTQAVLFLKYRQCIIIAPVVQRNFLCFFFVFYSFISYIFLYFIVLFLIYFCILQSYFLYFCIFGFIPYIFPLRFMVLLKQLRRLYTGSFIF